MNSRLKNLGFGSRRKTSSNNSIAPINHSPPPSGLTGGPSPPGTNSSNPNLPMNPNQLGRPPSYSSYPPVAGGMAPPPGVVGRSTSPMPPVNHMVPPINTAAGPGSYQQQPNMGGVGPPPAGPPGYGGYSTGGGAPPPTHGGGNPVYAPHRGSAVEVEGAGRSKAQLIVGIDFVGLLSANLLPTNLANIMIGNHLFRGCLCLRDEY
jgi:hypothetical protein